MNSSVSAEANAIARGRPVESRRIGGVEPTDSCLCAALWRCPCSEPIRGGGTLLSGPTVSAQPGFVEGSFSRTVFVSPLRP